MMGLTDRVEPWARRFQRAPRTTAETEAGAPSDDGAAGTRPRADGTTDPDPADRDPAAGPGSHPKTGRFTRGALQER